MVSASKVSLAAGASAPSCESGPPPHQVIKLGIDVHLDRYVVVRQIDGGAPQPPQRFSPSQFLEWAKKQTALAQQVYSCYEAGPFGYRLHRKLKEGEATVGRPGTEPRPVLRCAFGGCLVDRRSLPPLPTRPLPTPSPVEVGASVARRPPHRSRRAVFPHRALQVNSLSHSPSGGPSGKTYLPMGLRGYGPQEGLPVGLRRSYGTGCLCGLR